ncbi:MAG: hypothetical protein ACFB0C_15515 [Leptolyngbyaceae cyanobacterium]|mgnify:CR=1 FL=1
MTTNTDWFNQLPDEERQEALLAMLPPADLVIEAPPELPPVWAYEWMGKAEKQFNALKQDHEALAAAFQGHLFWGSVLGGFMAASILATFGYLFVRLGVLG